MERNVLDLPGRRPKNKCPPTLCFMTLWGSAPRRIHFCIILFFLPLPFLPPPFECPPIGLVCNPCPFLSFLPRVSVVVLLGSNYVLVYDPKSCHFISFRIKRLMAGVKRGWRDYKDKFSSTGQRHAANQQSKMIRLKDTRTVRSGRQAGTYLMT